MYQNVIERYAETRDIPEHIIVIIGPINAIMINLETQKTYEIGTHEIKKRIQEELNATQD